MFLLKLEYCIVNLEESSIVYKFKSVHNTMDIEVVHYTNNIKPYFVNVFVTLKYKLFLVLDPIDAVNLFTRTF